LRFSTGPSSVGVSGKSYLCRASWSSGPQLLRVGWKSVVCSLQGCNRLSTSSRRL